MTTKDLKTSLPKYLTVVNFIRDSIESGDLTAGSRLPTVRVLAEKFGVSITVVQIALRELEAQSIIVRRQNGIAFVNDLAPGKESGANEPDPGKILLCLPDDSHFYHSITGEISSRILSKGLLPVTLDYNKTIQLEPTNNTLKPNIEKLLKSDVRSAILSGNSYWRNPILRKHPEIRAVFMYVFDYPAPLPDLGIFLDYEEATYLTTSHLAKQGCKRILLETFRPDEHSYNMGSILNHHSTLIYNGYKRALREHNIANYEKVFYRYNSKQQDILKCFGGSDQPDGIISDLDFDAAKIAMTLIRANYRVPEDVKVCGLFNTPWSTDGIVPLTTVEFDIAKVPDLAVKLALDKRIDKKIHYIKPKLIVRESSKA